MGALLTKELYFPPISEASPEGIVAVGGDLSLERLVLAYSKGIFPWYNEQTAILWWSPPKRCMIPLQPKGLYITSRLQRKYNSSKFIHTINTAFEEVIYNCAYVEREGQEGTWLLPEMQEAYIALHKAGFAHSIECWQGSRLVGGLYGVAIGKAFFGESMFHVETDASKMALLTLNNVLKEHHFHFIDCQQKTGHMMRMGAEMISRDRFAYLLKLALIAGNSGIIDLGKPKEVHSSLPLLQR